MTMRRRRRTAGFTLLELVVMVAIIGILSAVIIPQFGESIHVSNDGSTRANLGTIRKAMSVYYSEIDGLYPQTLGMLTVNGRYLKKIPLTKTRTCPHSSAETAGTTADDAGGWLYDNAQGVVRVNCTGVDAKGAVWTTY